MRARAEGRAKRTGTGRRGSFALADGRGAGGRRRGAVEHQSVCPLRVARARPGGAGRRRWDGGCWRGGWRGGSGRATTTTTGGARPGRRGRADRDRTPARPPVLALLAVGHRPEGFDPRLPTPRRLGLGPPEPSTRCARPKRRPALLPSPIAGAAAQPDPQATRPPSTPRRASERPALVRMRPGRVPPPLPARPQVQRARAGRSAPRPASPRVTRADPAARGQGRGRRARGFVEPCAARVRARRLAAAGEGGRARRGRKGGRGGAEPPACLGKVDHRRRRPEPARCLGCPLSRAFRTRVRGRASEGLRMGGKGGGCGAPCLLQV